MHLSLPRRDVLKTLAAAGAAALMPGTASRLLGAEETAAEPLFKISLAGWSLNREIFGKKLDHLDFAKTAKEKFDIDAVEYVSQFFPDKAHDETYLGELKTRAADHGVKSLLIMIDHEGNLGDPDDAARTKSVEDHRKWLDAAKFLGCHSIRVNAGSKGTDEEQLKLAADGLGRLSEFAKPLGLNVIVENHGGNSSKGDWLAAVMTKVGMDNCGTLPDFGNFYEYDRYQGVRDMMPFAKAVSAKSYAFDDQGNETKIDYLRMMKIVLEFGYHGYVGIEFEGDSDEYAGVKATRDLLLRVREQLAGQPVQQ